MSSAEHTLAFRTTCSREIGFGHLRRCLTLAQELAGRGWRCAFWLTGDQLGQQLAAQAGFDVVPGIDRARFDAVVVDDYAVSARQIAAWHGAPACLAVIDDLADRALGCDLVHNGNANAGMLHYRTAPGCRLLLGPRYAMLRPSFRGVGPRPPGEVRRVLVTLGGSDPQGYTPRVVAQLLERLPQLTIDVIVGPLYQGALPEASDRVRLHRAPPNVTALMLSADLAVTSGGQTTYELAACGLPAIAICAAENQRGNLTALAAIPTLVLIEDPDRVSDAVSAVAADAALRKRMSSAGQGLVDGRGASRVALALEQVVRGGHGTDV
jgi:UDP-2,4-diacetamido-2,4,6-trideoxy-beta-L-altropyranose hydrolase